VTYAAEPFAQFVDDLLTALTGGVIREEFRFLPENAPFVLRAPGPPLLATVRLSGMAHGAYRRFQVGKDYRLNPDFSVNWLTSADAVIPDTGSIFFANYDYSQPGGVVPPLTDRNVGSVTRLFAESFAREYAVLSRQLEGVYDASFVATATGRDLDQLALLLGVERRTATYAVGSLLLFRSTPSPADIFVPAGTRLSTAKPPAAQFETQADATLRRGSLSVDVPIQSLVSGAAGVVTIDSITVLNSPILGIDGVSNPQPTSFQSASESDEQLRSRIGRALESAGKATPGALLAALTTIPGVREKDVQVVEDPIARPGVIQLNVALPELPPGGEAEALAQFAAQAIELIEETRPVGVRIVHNIDAPRPIGPAEAGPAVQPEEGGGPVTAGTPPTGSLSLPVDVNVWLTPASRSLSELERNELIRSGEDTVRAFIADAGIGETLVYNRLIALLIGLDGVLDVALELFPQAAPDEPRRKNILPVDPTLRPVAGKVDVQLRGSLIVLDVALRVTRKGAGLLTDPVQLSTTVAANVTDTLNMRFRTGSLSSLDVDSLKSLLASADSYDLNGLDYSVEYQDAGVHINKKNVSLTPTPSDQFWVRKTTVEVQ